MAIFPRAGRAQLKDGKIIPRKREYKTYEQSQIVRHIRQQGHQLNVSKLNPTEFYPENSEVSDITLSPINGKYNYFKNILP